MSAMSHRGRLGLLIGAVIDLLLMVALVGTIVFRQSVVSGFTSAADDYQQAQSDVAAALNTAQQTVAATNASQLDNPADIESLKTSIAQAQTATSENTDMPVGGTAIRQKSSDLRSRTQDLKNLKQQLNAGVAQVLGDHLTWAISKLQSSIDSAKTTLTQFKGRATDAALADLQAKITAAQTVLDAAKSGSQTSAVPLLSSINDLTTAQQNVTNSAVVRCDNGLTLPQGVSTLVCGDLPDNAQRVRTTGGDDPTQYDMFLMPSGNVACSLELGEVECQTLSFTWKPPASMISQCGPDGDCSGDTMGLSAGGVHINQHSDVPLWNAAQDEHKKIPVLAYQQVANFSPFACLSAEDGVTCWHVSTHHGFKISKSTFLYW